MADRKSFLVCRNNKQVACFSSKKLRGGIPCDVVVFCHFADTVADYRPVWYQDGGMERIKAMLISVSSDYRVLILLIALGFGGFLEGMALERRWLSPPVCWQGWGLTPSVRLLSAWWQTLCHRPMAQSAFPWLLYLVSWGLTLCSWLPMWPCR